MILNPLRLKALACSLALLSTAQVAQAHVTLIAPNGGETFLAGDQVLVEWTVAISHSLLDWDLWYSTTGPSGPWNPVAMDLPPGSNQVGSQHSYAWTIPNTPSTQAHIRVRMDNTGQDYFDVSDGAFTIDGGCCGTSYCTPAVPNSTGNPSTMAASGSVSITANDLVLEASDLPLNTFAFFLTSQTQGFVANPAGSQGNLCLQGNIGRYVGPGQIQNSGTTGQISLPIDNTTIPQPTGPVPATAGETWNFQLWHRDTLAGGATSNFSDGYEVTFTM